jgi:hypothetical protein
MFGENKVQAKSSPSIKISRFIFLTSRPLNNGMCIEKPEGNEVCTTCSIKSFLFPRLSSFFSISRLTVALKFIKDEISRLLYEAYDDEDSCTFVKIYKATKYIRQKYGFISNIESGFYDYSEMDRLVDRYVDIVISKLP